jgi:hypothetical protein
MIDLTTFFSNLGIVGGWATASNQYEFYYGIEWADGSTTYNQFDFYKKLGGRYQFFEQYGNEYGEFYRNGFNDPNIVDYYTFYQYAAAYIGGAPPVDPDVITFMTTAGISNATIESALNDFVSTSKSNGLWSKLYAIYPIVGANATQNSYNLKDVSTYQATLVGNWTYGSTGILGDGSTSYFNTGITPSLAAEISLNNYSFGCYTRINGVGTSLDFGSRMAAPNDTTRIAAYQNLQIAAIGGLFDPGHESQRITNFDGNPANSTNNFVSVSRTSASSAKIYYQDVIEATATAQSATQLPDVSMTFGALNNGGSIIPITTNEYAFIYAGVGLTDAEIDTLWTSVEALQTALSRNVR